MSDSMTEYQRGLERVANAVGVTTSLQLTAEADNDEQDYFDLLIKVIQKREVEAYKRGMNKVCSVLESRDRRALARQLRSLIPTKQEPSQEPLADYLHSHISRQSNELEGGLIEPYWECDSCGKRFLPEQLYQALGEQFLTRLETAYLLSCGVPQRGTLECSQLQRDPRLLRILS